MGGGERRFPDHLPGEVAIADGEEDGSQRPHRARLGGGGDAEEDGA